MEELIVLSILFTLIVCLLIILIIRQNNRIKEKDETILGISNENARLKAIQESFENYRKDIETINENSKDTFTSAAKDLFMATSSRFTDINRSSVEGIIKPLKEQIDSLRMQLNDTRVKNAENKAALETSIKNLVDQTQKIGEDAIALTKALKGDKKLQGNWGEALLNTILSSSGLKEGIHYFVQKTYYDDNGHNFRPDVVIILPQDDSSIIVDSKVSLNAYVDYCNTDDPIEKESLLLKHVDAIKSHVDELAAKDYSNLVKGSIGFVLMFVANEASYIAALEKSPTLLEYARQRKVIIVSPANLITALQLTLLLWKAELQKQNIVKIIDLGSKIYDKFVLFTDSFSKIGDSLKAANEAYDTTFNRLTIGKDNLVGKMRKFRELGLQPTKQLNKKYDNISDEDEIEM